MSRIEDKEAFGVRSEKGVIYGADDIGKIVLTKIGKLLKAKQHPCKETICKALHKTKGLA